MKTIVRKISLEQFKNRFIQQESGRVLADDIIVDSIQNFPMELEENLPILTVGSESVADDGIVRFRDNQERYYDDIPTGVSTRKILRYRTMLDTLTFINEFIRTSRLYQLCVRDGGRKMVEVSLTDFLNNPTEFRFAPSVPTITYTYAELLTDESGVTYFSEFEDANDESLRAYKLSFDGIDLFNDKNNTSGIINGTCIGDYYWINEKRAEFLKIFKISSDSGNLAALNRALRFKGIADNWKYVTNNFESYIPIPLYIEEESEDMGIFTSVVDEFVPGRKYIVGDKALDSDGIVWTLTSGEEVMDIPVPSTLTTFIEKMLLSGSEGYQEYSSDSAVLQNTGITYVARTAEGLVFKKGFYNVGLDEHWEKESDSSEVNVSGITDSKLSMFRKCDVDDEGEPLPFRLKYDNDGNLENGGTHLGETYYNTDIPYVGADTVVDTIHNSVTFTYYAEDEMGGGIVYTETYPFEERFGHFSVDGEIRMFRYLDIDYSVGEIYNDKLYTTFDATIVRDGTESQNVPYFKEEALFGIHDMTTTIGNTKIERGTSAAYERHSVLGEITSLEELVKYKNGFFDVKDDENG